MVRAWDIAREGHVNFGDKVSEYFAEIIGTHPRWKLNREFIEVVNEQVIYIDYSDVMEQVA